MSFYLLLSKFLSKINKLSAIIQLPQNSISLNFTNKQKHDKNNLFCKSTEHQKLFKRTINPNCTNILMLKLWFYYPIQHHKIPKSNIFWWAVEREERLDLSDIKVTFICSEIYIRPLLLSQQTFNWNVSWIPRTIQPNGSSSFNKLSSTHG